MSPYAFPALFAFLINLGIGFFVLRYGWGRRLNLIFGLLILVISSWNLGDLIMLNAGSSRTAEAGARLGSTNLAVPLFYYLFTGAFVDWTLKKQRMRFWLISSLPGLFILFFVFRDFARFFQVSYLDNLGVYYYGIAKAQDSVFHQVFLYSTMAAYTAAGVMNLATALKNTKRKRGRRLIHLALIITISFIVLTLTMALSLLMTHGLGLTIGLFIRMALSGLLGTLVLRFRFQDVFRYAERGMIFSLMTGVVMAIYVLIIKGLGATISRFAGQQSLLFESGMIVGLVFAFHPIRIWLEKRGDRLIFGNRPDLKAAFMKYSNEIQQCTSMKELKNITSICIMNSLSLNECLIMQYFPEEKTFIYDGNLAFSGPYFVKISEELRSLLFLGQDLDKEELGQITQHNLGNIDNFYAFPINYKNDTEALLILPENRERGHFRPAELEFLSAIRESAGNSMAHQKKIEELEKRNTQLRQSERLAALGELSAGLAHEIRNPLNIISGAAQTLKRNHNLKNDEELAEFIVEEVNRLNSMLTSFLDFARPAPLNKKRMDISEIVSEIAGKYDEIAKEKGIIIEKKVEPAICNIDPNGIKQVLLNLLLNALEVTDKRGKISIQVYNTEGLIHLKIKDNGSGMTKEEMAKAFDPFFTTKETGTGLGLPVAHRIIREHKGEISVISAPEEGTCFHITLIKSKLI